MLAVSPDGKYLAAAAREPLVQVWDMKTLREVHHLEAGKGFHSFLLFSPDSKTLFAKGNSADDNPFLVWDMATGKELPPIRGDGRRLSPIGNSWDGRTVAFVADDDRNWDFRTRPKPTFHLLDTVTRKVQDIKVTTGFFCDGNHILSRDKDGKLCHSTVAADGKDPQPLSKRAFTFDTNARICPDGKTAVTVDNTGDIRIFDLEAGREIQQMKALE